jgi:hypothetical protein
MEELAKGKGLPSEWCTKDTTLPEKAVKETTCVHIWSVVCDAIGLWLKQAQHGTLAEATTPLLWPMPPTKKVRAPQSRGDTIGKLGVLPPGSICGWKIVPRTCELSPESHPRPNRCGITLAGRIGSPGDPPRGNYSAEGPKYLQVLWWEFPAPHTEAIRIGSSMHFLIDPGEELVDNPKLTSDQLDVVCEFVEELRAMGVVRPATRPLKRVCPLFVVQWRCIADMKRGGQNGCCGLDPIFLPSLRDILSQIYTLEGGPPLPMQASISTISSPSLKSDT